MTNQSGYQPSRTRWEEWVHKYLRNRRAWLAYGTVAVLVVAFFVVRAELPRPPAPCPGNLVPADDGNPKDCAGLTDGSFVFSPALASVEGKIYTENEQVAKQAAAQNERWVAIAYMIPLTLNQTSPETVEGVTDEIEGAYTGQWEANNEHALYGDVPLIKLYLVNEGAEYSKWQVAVDQILAATRDSLHVVAVAGLGDSVIETRDAAQEMSASNVRLAMFGTSITADDLNGSLYPTLARIAPTNADEVRAALAFIPRVQGHGATAMVVKDTDTSDDYVRDWANDVTKLYPGAGHLFVSGPATFDPTLPNVDDVLQGDAEVACEQRPDVVFFAGRAKQLEVFVGALGADCSTPITVMSGDDDLIDQGTGDDPDDYTLFNDALSGGVVSLYSTELASAQEWSGCGGSVPPSQDLAARQFPQFEKDYKLLLGQQLTSLPDASGVMLGRDAVITAVKAIRLPNTEPGVKEVTGNLALMKFNPVSGATGMITIGNNGPTTGDALDKPLVIVQHVHSAVGSEQCRAVEVP